MQTKSVRVTPPVPAAAAPSAAPESKAPEASRTIVFEIPLAPPSSSSQGTPVVTGGASTPASAAVTGRKLEPTKTSVGTPVAPEAVEVLRKAFLKDGDTYAVTDAQLLAAKRALLTYWGFPKVFVKAHADKMKLHQVGETGSAVDANGRVSGTMGDQAFEGWIASNDDWTKDDVKTVMAGVKLPAESLTLHASFFEHNGVAKADRKAVTERLFAALSNWKTASDSEVAWAKGMLAKAFDLPASFTLNFLKGYDSVVDSNQTIHGTVHEKFGADGPRDETVGGIVKERAYGFAILLASGIRAAAPLGWHLKAI